MDDHGWVLMIRKGYWFPNDPFPPTINTHRNPLIIGMHVWSFLCLIGSLALKLGLAMGTYCRTWPAGFRLKIWLCNWQPVLSILLLLIAFLWTNASSARGSAAMPVQPPAPRRSDGLSLRTWPCTTAGRWHQLPGISIHREGHSHLTNLRAIRPFQRHHLHSTGPAEPVLHLHWAANWEHVPQQVSRGLPNDVGGKLHLDDTQRDVVLNSQAEAQARLALQLLLGNVQVFVFVWWSHYYIACVPTITAMHVVPKGVINVGKAMDSNGKPPPILHIWL